MATLSTHLGGWVSRTRGVGSTTEAVHLGVVYCVDTSGFLLAIEGLLTFGTHPPGFVTDGSADCKKGDPAVGDIEAKGSDRLSKSAYALRHRVSVCAYEGSAWNNEGGDQECKQTRSSKQKDQERGASSSLLDIDCTRARVHTFMTRSSYKNTNHIGC
jgi:hypothetical protein